MSTSNGGRPLPSMRFLILIGSVLFAGLLPGTVAVAQAAVGLGKATTFRARFTTHRAGAASGLALKTAGQVPSAGVTEAPAVRQTVILPVGTKLELRRLPQCTASDAQIAAQGAENACPRTARVGSGGADGVLAGSPVHFDLAVYAVRGQLRFAAERAGVPLKQAFAGRAQGAHLILTVPTLGGRIAPTGFDARIGAHPGGKTWLVTPATCSRTRPWFATGRFQGVSSTAPAAPAVTPAQTLTDHLRCAS